MIKETVTRYEVVEMLNEIIKLDPVCAEDFLNGKHVECNEALADHPTIQVHSTEKDGKYGPPYSVRLLGLLNGLFGIDEETGSGSIIMHIDDEAGKIEHFSTSPIWKHHE